MLSGKAPHLPKCRDSKVAPARDLGGRTKDASATSPQPAWRLRRHNPSRCPGTGGTLIGKLPVCFQTRWVFTDFPDMEQRRLTLTQ